MPTKNFMAQLWWNTWQPHCLAFTERLQTYMDSKVFWEWVCIMYKQSIPGHFLSSHADWEQDQYLLHRLIWMYVHFSVVYINSVHTVTMIFIWKEPLYSIPPMKGISKPLDTLEQSNCSMIHTWLSMLGSALAFSRASTICECPFLHA